MGDRNTTYFHPSTVIQQGRNGILALYDSSDNLITNQVDLMILNADFFRSLYTNDSTRIALSIATSFTGIPNVAHASLYVNHEL